MQKLSMKSGLHYQKNLVNYDPQTTEIPLLIFTHRHIFVIIRLSACLHGHMELNKTFSRVQKWTRFEKNRNKMLSYRRETALQGAL